MRLQIVPQAVQPNSAETASFYRLLPFGCVETALSEQRILTTDTICVGDAQLLGSTETVAAPVPQGGNIED